MKAHLVANYTTGRMMHRETVLTSTVKRCNKELLRIKVNRFIVDNWNSRPYSKPRLVKHTV